MVKTIMQCDFCGCEINAADRIQVTCKAGRGKGGCRHYDFCPQCWDRIRKEAKEEVQA